MHRLSKYQTQVPADPPSSFLGICPVATLPQMQDEVCARLFIVALFITTKEWRKCPPMGGGNSIRPLKCGISLHYLGCLFKNYDTKLYIKLFM